MYSKDAVQSISEVEGWNKDKKNAKWPVIIWYLHRQAKRRPLITNNSNCRNLLSSRLCGKTKYVHIAIKDRQEGKREEVNFSNC